jgi:type 1 glutamine amidotransferase
MRRHADLFVAFGVALALGCASDDAPSSPSGSQSAQADNRPPIQVLMVTATAGFRHGSIAAAREAMTALGAGDGFVVTATEDLEHLSAQRLASYDVLCFCLTTGELPLSAAQKDAILAFVSGGKGFIGVHSATDTLYEWPDYGRLVGAYFKEHPWTQPAAVVVENGSHPAAAGLVPRFTLTEEFYTFRENPRPPVEILLRLDPATVGSFGDFPLAWANAFGGGRTYYNALGHFDETWRDARFQQQIARAVRWLAGRT